MTLSRVQDGQLGTRMGQQNAGPPVMQRARSLITTPPSQQLLPAAAAPSIRLPPPLVDGGRGAALRPSSSATIIRRHRILAGGGTAADAAGKGHLAQMARLPAEVALLSAEVAQSDKCTAPSLAAATADPSGLLFGAPPAAAGNPSQELAAEGIPSMGGLMALLVGAGSGSSWAYLVDLHVPGVPAAILVSAPHSGRAAVARDAVVSEPSAAGP